MISWEIFGRNFPQKKVFPTFSPEMSEKLVEKFPGNSPENTFSPWFTERFPENARKFWGKFPGEIFPSGSFPSGSFPDFPKFSRREIFTTNFHHNVTNKSYLYNWLQPVNQTFTRFVSQHFRGKLLQEKTFPWKHVTTFFGENVGKNFPGKVSSHFVKMRVTPPGRNLLRWLCNMCFQHTFRKHFYRKI